MIGEGFGKDLGRDPLPNHDLQWIWEEIPSQTMIWVGFGKGFLPKRRPGKDLGKDCLPNDDLGRIWEGIPSQTMIWEEFREGFIPK